MASDDFELAPPPESQRARELWLQHAAGFILFEDVRRYAADQIDPNLPAEVRAQAQRSIDDALYGIMMIADGVTGALSNETENVRLRIVAQHARNTDDDDSVLTEIDLFDGDGMCMGFHGWLDGDFGSDDVAIKSAK